MTRKSPAKKAKELSGTRVKLRFRNHFVPPLAGLFVVILIFGVLNADLVSGKIAYYMFSRPGSVTSLDSHLAGATTIDKNAPPKVMINKISVNAPIIFDQKTVDQAAFQKALKNGVVHYPDTALPGQPGNVVIFGHSSGQWWAQGDYKFVFTLLDKLKLEDRIFIDYQGTRYIYRVKSTTVVRPTDLSVLNQGSGNTLTLITCSPVGSNSKRLIIHAEQIVPKVTTTDTSSNQPATLPANADNNLPGNAPSFWQSLQELF